MCGAKQNINLLNDHLGAVSFSAEFAVRDSVKIRWLNLLLCSGRTTDAGGQLVGWTGYSAK